VFLFYRRPVLKRDLLVCEEFFVAKRKVCVLGATGTVGQRFLSLLENHPWFEVVEITASERSAGRRYEEAANWILPGEVPEYVKKMEISPTNPEIVEGVDILFSALPSDVARKVEMKFASKGMVVSSNASANRMELDVPLVIPEVNPDHLSLIDIQKKKRDMDGFVVTNPNCTTIPLAMVLKPLNDVFGVAEVFVASMQAVSGAGLPGVASLNIFDNVIPWISGEEEKVEKETLKLLGKVGSEGAEPAGFKIATSCNRVPTIDGHLECVFVRLEREVNLSEVGKILRNFRGEPQDLKLPMAPENPIIVREEVDRPQTRMDRDAGKGMSVSVGRIRKGVDEKSIRLVLLGHNTIRGAAGAALLNAELVVAKSMV